MNKLSVKAILAVAVVTLLMAACGVDEPGDGGGLEPTITLADAARKVDAYAEQARAALNPPAKFINPYKNYDFPCSNADGSPSPDRRDARVSYQLEGVTPEQVPGYFQNMRSLWEKIGFTVTDDQKGEFLGAKNTVDGFTMGLQANNVGEVYLKVSSPCVWRNGTPKPTK